MEKNLAAHIEANPQLWFIYVNDKEFLNMTMNNAANKPEKQETRKVQGRKKNLIILAH